MRAISGARAGCSSSVAGRANAAPRVPTKRPLARRALIASAAGPAGGPAAGPPGDAGEEGSLTLPVVSPDMDWRAFRAQLVAATATTDEANSSADSSATPAPPRPTSADGDALWAHRIAEPERGCLLVAHPLMFSNAQTYFSQVRERVERREVG